MQIQSYTIMINKIKNWFKNDNRIKEVYICNDNEYYAKSNKKYKNIQIEFDSLESRQYHQIMNVHISVSDILPENLVNFDLGGDMESIILSECIDILVDFKNSLNQEANYIENNVLYQPFHDVDNDRTYGITAYYSIIIYNRDCITN